MKYNIKIILINAKTKIYKFIYSNYNAMLFYDIFLIFTCYDYIMQKIKLIIRRKIFLINHLTLNNLINIIDIK